MLRVRVAITGWEGGPGLSTFYFTVPTQDAAAASRVAAHVRAKLNGSWAPQSPNAITLTTSGDVDVLNAATGVIENTLSVAAPAPIAGTGGTSWAPFSVAMLLQLRTSTFINGRRVRGRSFLSPVRASAIAAHGSLDETQRNAMQVAGEDFRTSVTAGDTWVVWHRPVNGAGGSAAQITSVTVPGKPAILRSRRD